MNVAMTLAAGAAVVFAAIFAAMTVYLLTLGCVFGADGPGDCLRAIAQHLF